MPEFPNVPVSEKTIASLSAIVPGPVYEITFDATPVAVLVTYT